MGVSPQRVEHLARGYFGWLGTQALSVSDYLARPLWACREPAPRTRAGSTIIVGDFVKEADPRSSKYTQRFYDQQREVNQVYAAYSQARELGDLDRARALAGDDHLRVRALFKAADSQLRDVNQKIKALERADIPTDEARAAGPARIARAIAPAAVADQHARAGPDAKA